MKRTRQTVVAIVETSPSKQLEALPTPTPIPICPALLFIDTCKQYLLKKPRPNPYEEYTGYITYNLFPHGMLRLQAYNRIVNQDRVKSMVARNIEKLKQSNTYEDFNTVKLLVDRSVHTNDVCFYIADGQHRMHVARELFAINPDVNIDIHVTITIVNTAQDAINYLMHFQNCLSPDYRLFSTNEKERDILQRTIDLFRAKYPKSFVVHDDRQRKLVQGTKNKNYRLDVERPHLSDGIIADFIKGPCVINILAEGNATNELLDDMNTYLRTLFPQSKVDKIECIFGQLRSRENPEEIKKLNDKVKTL
jgi:hypothetical protein